MEAFNFNTLDITFKQWMLAISIMMGSVLIGKLFFWIFSKTLQQVIQKTSTRWDDILIGKSKKPIIYSFVLISSRFALSILDFPKEINEIIQRVFVFLLIILGTWLVTRLIDAFVSEIIQTQLQREGEESRESFSPVLKKVIGVGVWTMGGITALNNAGFDVGALLTGLGIGGLALALASQDTVKNMIGGLIIIFDKPFGIGDHVQVDQMEGKVEDIGLRSTRLRGMDGKLISIPNALFSDKPIINVSREKNKKVFSTIMLSYANDKEKINKLPSLLLDVLDRQKELYKANKEVFVTRLLPEGIELKIQYLIQRGNNYSKVQSNINMKILETLNQHGIEIAKS